MPKKDISNFYEPYRRRIRRKWPDAKIPKPDPKNGVPGNKIALMFVNKRPGRKGTGASGLISFDNEDPTARRFKRLFEKLGIDRKRIFITNACIFYHSDETYRDKPPSKDEYLFSAEVLKDQIDRVNPTIIVPMGNTARNMLKNVYSNSDLRAYRLKSHIGEVINNTPLIFPLYHTADRALRFRREKEQENDWGKLKGLI
jgi:uracil-DNA glycosylase family 4